MAGGSSGIAGFAAILYAIPTAGVTFSYLGFRQTVEYGGEGKPPEGHPFCGNRFLVDRAGRLHAPSGLPYFGSFGLNPIISFPTDTVVSAVLTLGAHYDAVYTGFRAQAIEDVLEELKEFIQS
jgi:hypothetical protein